MNKYISFLFFISLLFIIILSIPQDQKEKCQKVAENSDDCLVELDDSYFCCYLKATTVDDEEEANLCAVIEAKEINKRVNKYI